MKTFFCSLLIASYIDLLFINYNLAGERIVSGVASLLVRPSVPRSFFAAAGSIAESDHTTMPKKSCPSRVTSVTRFGDFENSWQKMLAKDAQMIGNFLGYF